MGGGGGLGPGQCSVSHPDLSDAPPRPIVFGRHGSLFFRVLEKAQKNEDDQTACKPPPPSPGQDEITIDTPPATNPARDTA